MSPLTSNDAYALWLAGLVALGVAVVQAVRASNGPSFHFPHLTGRHLSSVLAWLIIAASAVIVAARQK